MSINFHSQYEEKDKRRSWIVSFIIHVTLLLLFFVPFLNKSIEEEASGIFVVFGDPLAGQNDFVEQNDNEAVPTEKASAAASSASENNIYSKVLEDESPTKAQNVKEVDKNKSEKIATDVKSKADADKKAKEESEARRKAEEQRKAELEKSQKQATEKKKQFSDLFGKGQGNNNNSGNQGQTTGDPDGKSLEGISSGTGKIGGGLAGRGVLFSPNISDNSQKTGRVALNICVDSSGKVVQADFTQRGSTTSDSYLINIARQHALKYKFSPGEVDKQCGTLTIDFKVQ